MARKTIYAEEGMILTNGEIYGEQILLAEGLNESGFWQITKELYATLMLAEEANNDTQQDF